MIICDMGMQRLYYDSGGFSKYLYHQVGETIIASNGIEGKIETITFIKLFRYQFFMQSKVRVTHIYNNDSEYKYLCLLET